MEKEPNNQENKNTKELSKEILQANSIKSEEVLELIGAVPHWLIRSGISLVGFTLTIFFIIAWFVKYPDVLNAKTLITTNPSPIILVARSSGPIALLKSENERIEKGEIIAVIESSENWQEILRMEQAVLHNEDQRVFKMLGSIQSKYDQYWSSKIQLDLLKESKKYSLQLSALKKQLKAQKLLKINLEKQLNLSEKQLDLALELFMTDSLLYSQQVISKIDFQQKKSVFLQVKKEVELIKANAINQNIRIEELEERLTKLKIDDVSVTNQHYLAMTGSKNELLAAIENWKRFFLIIAEQPGTVSYLDVFQNGKFINTGTPLFSIVPETHEILAIANLPSIGSGKVKTGQKVNIKLDQYPYNEYGMLVGNVKNISLVPVENNYKIEIDLSKKLTTTHGSYLEIKLDLTGQTEIITEDLNLIERMFHWVREIGATDL